jgi:hypothetical protein
VPEVLHLAAQGLRMGAQTLLLLGYKGSRPEFAATEREVGDAFALLCKLGRTRGVAVAADDHTRRRLGLSRSCGDGFLRISLEGEPDRCCFPGCEYREEDGG